MLHRLLSPVCREWRRIETSLCAFTDRAVWHRFPEPPLVGIAQLRQSHTAEPCAWKSSWRFATEGLMNFEIIKEIYGKV